MVRAFGEGHGWISVVSCDDVMKLGLKEMWKAGKTVKLIEGRETEKRSQGMARPLNR